MHILMCRYTRTHMYTKSMEHTHSSMYTHKLGTHDHQQSSLLTQVFFLLHTQDSVYLGISIAELPSMESLCVCVCWGWGVLPPPASWDTFVQILYPPPAFPERPYAESLTLLDYSIGSGMCLVSTDEPLIVASVCFSYCYAPGS